MSGQVSEPLVVFITAPNKDEARRLANALIESELAACVQILPEMESIYRWQGVIEQQSEILILAKTTSAKFAELEKEVRRLHTYEVPEILAVPVVAVSQPYLEWINKTLNPDAEEG